MDVTIFTVCVQIHYDNLISEAYQIILKSKAFQ